jgi:adenylate cyclase
MVAYTSLMERDEALARQFVKQERDVLSPEAEVHGGTVHRQFGHGFLITFASAVGAVRCALFAQSTLVGEDQPNLRMGLDMGDVAITDDDFHGPAVNTASRLQSLASPGTVVISGNVWRQVRNQAEFETEFLNTEALRNIS